MVENDLATNVRELTAYIYSDAQQANAHYNHVPGTPSSAVVSWAPGGEVYLREMAFAFATQLAPLYSNNRVPRQRGDFARLAVALKWAFAAAADITPITVLLSVLYQFNLEPRFSDESEEYATMIAEMMRMIRCDEVDQLTRCLDRDFVSRRHST